MFDESPFRERPKFMLCPRCGELLDRAFEGVLACLRCEGVWIPAVALAKAFGESPWPDARRLWWRDELECPECASAGVTTEMRAAGVDGIVFDRCHDHGVWLDRFELSRLAGAPRAGDGGGISPDLELLRERLAVAESEVDAMGKRREAWRADLEQRRKAALEYRSWLDAEHRRRTEAAESRAREEAQRDHARAIQRLGESREEAASQVGRAEAQIIMLREQLRTAEAELDGARARLRAIDDQLAALRSGESR